MAPAEPVDWFAEAVERVADAGRDTSRAIESTVRAVQAGRTARTAGQPLLDVVDDLITAGGREVRLGAAEKFSDFERAIAWLRARVVRALVDDDGLSLTEVAKRMRISRQAAGRLYRSAAR